MAKMLMIHADKCTGCRNCELACSMSHEGAFRLQATRVHVYTWEREGFSVPMMCQQCRRRALHHGLHPARADARPVTGLVNLDQAKCIGCKMCVQACPFGNAVWDELTNKILKCDNCGGDPACAKFCPSHALEWVDDIVATRDAQARVRGQVQRRVLGVKTMNGWIGKILRVESDDGQDVDGSRSMPVWPGITSARAVSARSSCSTRSIRRSIRCRRTTS